MTYATILVHAEDSNDSDERIKRGLGLAHAFSARMIGVAGIMPRLILTDPFGTGAMAGELITLEEDITATALKGAEARFQAAVAAEGNRHEWRGRVGFPANVVNTESRAADLVVIGREPRKLNGYEALDCGDVLMGAGRPVLLVPDNHAPEPVGAAAIIAWKDSPESRRAVRDALPFLRKASSITIMEISGDTEMFAATHTRLTDVAHFLRSHGVHAEVSVLPDTGYAISTQIIEQARQRRIGLIVAGAYGHARAREWIFGGVTRELMWNCPVCCLFSH